MAIKQGKKLGALAYASATVLLVGAGVVLGAAPANATDRSVSIAAYCARNVPSGTGSPSIATNINNRWDGWRCGTRTGLVQVSVALACQQQVGINAKAVVVNNTASGWRCRT